MKKVLLPLLGSAILLGAALLAVGQTRLDRSSLTTRVDIAAACKASIGPEGFGIAVVREDLELVGEDVVLPTPCVIHLTEETHLSIRQTHLRSSHLIITDRAPDLRTDDRSVPARLPPSSETSSNFSVETPRLRIEDSTLISEGSAGLFVRFLRPGGSIVVRGSTFDYPRSVMFATADMEGTTANDVLFADSTLRSLAPDSEGVWVSAAGSAEFISDRFETSANDGYAFLFAERCQQRGVTGARDLTRTIESMCFPR